MRRALAILVALCGCSGPPAAVLAPDASARTATGEPAAIVDPTARVDRGTTADVGARAAIPTSRSIPIPAGPFTAGSPPGTPGRRPSREADEVVVELAAFSIDRLPFPNDPLAAPRLVTSRAEAAALCASVGERLCNELEWERACEGVRGDRFPGGATLDPDRCTTSPEACASAEGVLRMGIEHPEWTASDVPPASVRMGRSAVLRGAAIDAPRELHRCASRSFEVPAQAPAAAFRCCSGSASDVAYPAPAMHREIRDLATTPDALRAALRSVDALAPFADSFTPYDATDGERALARGDVDRTALAGWELAPGPFAWSPSPGEELWVIAGSAGDRALLALLHPLPDGRFVHAASLVIEPEPDQTAPPPIAIARTPPSRTELQWSTCWGCPGEGGVVRFEDDATIRIVSR